MIRIESQGHPRRSRGQSCTTGHSGPLLSHRVKRGTRLSCWWLDVAEVTGACSPSGPEQVHPSPLSSPQTRHWGRGSPSSPEDCPGPVNSFRQDGCWVGGVQRNTEPHPLFQQDNFP